MSTVACGGSVPPDIHKTPANYRLQRSILMAATYAFNLCNHIANLGVWFDSRPRDVLLWGLISRLQTELEVSFMLMFVLTWSSPYKLPSRGYTGPGGELDYL